MQTDADARFGEDPQQLFRRRHAEVLARIAAACTEAGRDPAGVRLLPVTKTVPAEILRHAHAAGLDQFAENKVQEARGKVETLADLPLRWSMVGHLQTNKVKYAVRFASEFQALDSLRLAAELDRQLDRAGRKLAVHVQVNTSGEASKYGLSPAELPAFLDALAAYPRLKPQGLMTLALFSGTRDQVRGCFRLLRRLRDENLAAHPAVNGLSMGMSGDFEDAVREGATVVRVGQALFGTRPTPDGHYWPGTAGTPADAAPDTTASRPGRSSAAG
ncbi:YggS family pyridoxal phosphate-dependent enzyme [Cribrihabitans pelagius]|uniref:YggS family pyridoxal phosphate-dependent enzyme n=1 Tax=Cribrihabitans pelagius TaxID=1765746 RepID=UPI003B5B73B6